MTKEEILKQIQEMLASLFESIDAVDLVVKLQKTIGKKIMPEDFKTVRTVQDVVDVVYKLVNSK